MTASFWFAVSMTCYLVSALCIWRRISPDFRDNRLHLSICAVAVLFWLPILILVSFVALFKDQPR